MTVRDQVVQVVGRKGDETILDYVISILEDEDFHLGEHGEEAFEAFGEMLVDGGFLDTENAAKEVCEKLAQLLGRDAPQETFRALKSGPIVMDNLTSGSMHSSDKFCSKHLIQTKFDDNEMSVKTDRDAIKLKKREDKEEKQRQAALAAHQALVAESVAGAAPVIVRNQGGGGSKDLHLENFCVSNGGAELIQDADLMLAFGRRYGLIGRNGTGKTTLLRAMASHAIPGIPTNWQILHVEQEVVGDDTSVIEAVLQCDVERTQLLQEEAQLMSRLSSSTEAATETTAEKPKVAEVQNGGGGASDLEATARLEQVVKRLHDIDAFQAESKAAAILAGLSFDTDMQRRATKTFSGGWRMRVALARALFVQPDLLLLDEPTNHLDLHAVLWLEEYLVKWPKTLLLVSHAREFLNEVCTDIVHLHSCKLTPYKGNYDIFERVMTERVKNQKKAAEAQQMKKQHMQAFIDKFRYNAKRAALVQSRIKALEKLADVEAMEVDPEYRFEFPTPDDAVSPPILGFVDVDFGYPGGPLLFKNLNFGLDLESRAAIVGPNGIGKTTLLNLMGGVLEPVSGVVSRNPRVRMVMFSQHHVDGLDLSLCPLAYMMKTFPNIKEPAFRSHLASFGVGPELSLQPMYTLSGGQKSRVAFAKVTWSKPHMLLLDEPSNHLDLDAVQALIHGLNMFKGGVLMVSHDQHLIESTVDELWAVEDSTIKPFHGTFEDYKKRLRALEK